MTFAQWRGDLKIMEAFAEYDFVLKGSLECFVLWSVNSCPLGNLSVSIPKKSFCYRYSNEKKH